MKKIISLLMGIVLVLSMAPAVAEVSEYNTLYSGEVTSLNYLTTSTTSEFALAANVIDTLVEYDSFGQVRPSLAESWENTNEGLTWTFKIRKGVKWVDGNGKEVAEVTAHDFVSAAKYILNAQNASGTADILYGVIEGAEAYFDGTATPKEGQEAAPVMAWDTVGIKALDDYTLEYTLIAPTPYFLSMTTYVCFMPVYEPFLTAKADTFGLATGNDTLLYCGAYYLSEFKPQENRTLSKNELNWDVDNVTIDRVVYKYNKEAKNISASLYLTGAVDSASIENDIAAEWLADPTKADYIRPVRQTSFYSYMYFFNFNPAKGLPAEYQPENWALAVANENFRQSLFAGFDRVKAMTITDPDNAEELIYNSVTPPNFVTYEGVDFVNMGSLGEISAKGAGTFNPDAALDYKAAAMDELKDTVTFPVLIYMPYNTSVSGWAEESQLVEQQLEGLLGTDYIDVIIDGYPSSGFLNSTRRAGNYCMMKSNWGPDYADPQTFTDPFRAVNNSYLYLSDNTHADVKAMADEYYAMVEKAHTITDNIEARYLAYAEAEAYLINHAVAIPFGPGSGGYTASRIDPFTQQFAPFGISNERYKGSVLLDEPMSTDMYYDAYDQWLEAREALSEE